MPELPAPDPEPIQVEHPVPPDTTPAHLDTALVYVGLKEDQGNNRGPEIERFLASVGFGPGTPYCAAFVSYCLTQTGAALPIVRTALATNFISDGSIEARLVLRGTIVIPTGTIVIWRRGDTIKGHTGFVTSWDGASGRTVEGNTSAGAGNPWEGDGVWDRERTIVPTSHFRIVSFTLVGYDTGNPAAGTSAALQGSGSLARLWRP